MTVSPDFRPRLAAMARVHFDRHESRYLLLYPERGLALNDSAADIARLCQGDRTISEIAALLGSRHGASDPEARDAIASDVVAFVSALAARRLVVDAR
jgi:coenzyme PQQ biosynthesis protein PqqD